MGSGATVSGTWPATPRIALAFAHCSCVLMGSLHGLAIRLPVPRKSHELRRDGSRVANITPSVADKGRSTKRAGWERHASIRWARPTRFAVQFGPLGARDTNTIV